MSEWSNDGTLGIDLGKNIAPQRLAKLARTAGRFTAQHLFRLEAQERYALLVAFLIEFKKDLFDQIIGMHNKLIGQLFNRSERQQITEFQNNGRAVNEKIRLYAKVGKVLIEAKASQRTGNKQLTLVLSWEQFIATVEEAEKLASDENLQRGTIDRVYYEISTGRVGWRTVTVSKTNVFETRTSGWWFFVSGTWG